MCVMVETWVKVKNESGLHVRPAACLAKILRSYQAEVTLTYKGESVDARSIMSLMLLTIPKNANIHLVAKGLDAQQVVNQLVWAFETRFGEEG